jgi:hypothetical protein
MLYGSFPGYIKNQATPPRATLAPIHLVNAAAQLVLRTQTR